MSDEFSDDLSDPTPSPPPVRSSSKAINNTRKGATTLATGRGKAGAKNKPAVSGPGHSRTHSQANSVTMSIQSGSHAKAAAISKRRSRSQSNSAGSQSGSDLSSPPSEEEKGPARPEEDEEDEDEDEEEDEDEDENGDEDKSAIMPITAGRAGRAAMSQRSTRRNSSTRGRGTRSSRGVIPAPMWEWAKKKNYKRPKASQSDDDDNDNEDDDDEDDMENVGDVLGQSATGSSIVTDKPLHLGSHANSQDPEDLENDDAREEIIEKSFIDQGAGKTELIQRVVEDDFDSRRNHEPNDEDNIENDDLDMVVPSVKVEPPPSTVFSPKALPNTLLDPGDLDYQREDDLMNADDDVEGDVDLELQAADRQDALDALALLELKLAMVRQRLFQDKMDELGREEDMIRNGTHPELLHTIAELDKRRERRIQLAENKRKRDLELASKLRSHEEDAVWSWWGIQKDMLQSTMITEASRKRRKVERDRRALLDPIRRTLETFPPEPPKGLRNQNSIPSLKEVVSVALRHPYARLPHSFITERASTHSMPNSGNKGLIAQSTNPRSTQAQTATMMPTMSQLTEAEIQDDLELLLEYRRPFEDLDIVSHSGHYPNFAPPGGVSLDIPPSSGPHGRMINEHSRNPYDTGRRDIQSYPDHLTSQNRSISSTNTAFGSGGTNGRDRPPDQEKVQASGRNYPPGHGHPSLSGPSYHSHPRPSNQVSSQSPGLGFQALHRAPEGSLPIQNIPLPPAPSTLPQSNANKSNHAVMGIGPGHGGSASHSQHPGFSWESGRREQRDHEGHVGRDRHSAVSSKNSVAPNSSYVPASAGSTSSHGGRSHSHSVSHHFHPAHSHNQPQHIGTRPHTHTVQVHHHSQSHSHHPTSSHLHVIHNHAPMAPPTELSKNAPYRHDTAIRPGYQAEKGNRTETTASAWKSSGYEEGEATRPRSSYSNGPDKDTDKEFHRAVPASTGPLLPPISQPHERSSVTSTFHHPSQHVFSRESWGERDYEDRERHQGREKELQRERSHSNSATTYAAVSTSERHSTATQPSTSQPTHSNLSRYQHPVPSRTGSSIGYSPPLSASSISRRDSPPLLPPVPNTSHRYTSTVAGVRHSPTATSSEPPDVLPANVPFHTQPGTPDLPSATPVNLSGFNPWSAPPRATGRPSTAGSPTLLAGQTQITKPASSMVSSATSSSLSPHRTSTSPILARPQPSISPAPRPSLSPAPRPPSSSSIHSILQPPLRETGQRTLGSSSNTFSPSKRASNDSASMEIDPILPTGSTHFGLHPSSK